MQRPERPSAGTFDWHVIQSEALAGNPLGDPAGRDLVVYAPPEYRWGGERPLPVLYLLHAMGNSLESWWNRNAFRPTVPELLDDLFSSDDTPPMLTVFVDAWTALGGSQYLNSPAIGRYQDYLCNEVVPFVDARYSTVAAPEGRALAGHSSGGYGAMVVPMLRPDVFGALATHSGDALFDYAYMPDVAAAARALRYNYGGSYQAFWDDFRSRPGYTKSSDGVLLNVYAMAAAYSADANGTVQLPFDPETCILREDVWQRWLDCDPVQMAPGHVDALRALRGIWIDAGKRDEYNLDVAAMAFAARLSELGVDHHFELHDGGHSRIEYVYPRAWRYLAERVAR